MKTWVLLVTVKMLFLWAIIGQIWLFDVLAYEKTVDNYVDNSPKEPQRVQSSDGKSLRRFMKPKKTLALRRGYEMRQTWYIRRMILFEDFDGYYHTLQKRKRFMLLSEPLPIDYGLLMRGYIDNCQYPSLNPIDANELHFHELYFDSTAMRPRSPEQIFIDFFAKYNAAIVTLHLWVESFIASQLEIVYTSFDNVIVNEDEEKEDDENDEQKNDKKKDDAIQPSEDQKSGSVQPTEEEKEPAKIQIKWQENYIYRHNCDTLAYYTHWFLNLEIDRHLFDLENIMYNFKLLDEELMNVFTAFKDIRTAMKEFISLDFFLDRSKKLLPFGHKENPFDKTPKKEVLPTNRPWLLIIQYLSTMNIKAGKKIHVENFKDVISGEKLTTTIPTEYINDPDKYAEYLHKNSWEVIDMFMGDQLYTLESFFYVTLLGEKHPLEKFAKPSFNLRNRLKEKVNKFLEILTLDTKQPRKMFGDYGEVIHRSNIIDILRNFDYIRYEYSSPMDEKFGKGFILRPCSLYKFNIFVQCPGSFRFFEKKPKKIGKNDAEREKENGEEDE